MRQRRRPVGARRAPVRPRRRDGEHEEQRFEAEAVGLMRSRRASRGGQRGRSSSATQPEREQLLDHHHEPGDLLVGERREPVRAVVVRVERREGEDEHVGQDLPARRTAPPRARRGRRDGQPAVRAGVDEQRPDEHAADHPADVLEVVQRLVRGAPRRRGRDVPDREVRRPERRTRRAAAAASRARRARRALRASGASTRRGEEEDEQRPAQRRDHQRGAEIPDQHVLPHVGREELVVRRAVERPDEREQRDGEPEREERGAGPTTARSGAPAAAQPQPALGEERQPPRPAGRASTSGGGATRLHAPSTHARIVHRTRARDAWR